MNGSYFENPDCLIALEDAAPQRDFRFIETLPEGDWRLASFNGKIFAASPEHGVRIYPKDSPE